MFVWVCELRATAKLEGTVHTMTILTLTPITSSGVHKSTLRFDNLPESLTELTEIDYIHSMVYYRERLQIKISQREKRIGHSFCCSLPRKSGHVVFLALLCDSTHGELPTCKRTHTSVFGILLGLHFAAMIPCPRC